MIVLTAEQRAKAILRALSGQHLHDWLPGGDHQRARSRVVSSMAGWGGADGWGQVTAKGIELWFGSHPSAAPDVRITWREVIDIIARGATAEHLSAYRDAYQFWSVWCRAGGYQGPIIDQADRRAAAAGDAEAQQRVAVQQTQVHRHQQAYSRAIDALRDATAAIVNAGCQDVPIQPALF